MNQFRSDLHDVGVGVVTRVQDARDAVARTSPGVVLVRFIVGVTAFASLAVAFPLSVLESRFLWLYVFVGLCAAFAPRSRWITIIALLAIGGYLVATFEYAEGITLWRVSLLSATLYAMHTGAGLAAVLPYDAAISPVVLARWARRTGAVTGVGLVIGVCGLVVAERLSTVVGLAAPLIGIAAAGGLAVVLAWLVRR